MCWELVGLTSYLLIGFWYHKPSAAAAAKKAFITTRIGDLGLPPRHGLALLADRHAALLRRRRRLPGSTRALANLVAQTTSHRHGRLDRHRAADLLRRRRQVRPGAAARLAARRDGRPHARQRADPRRHDGRGRCVPRRARLSADERCTSSRRHARTPTAALQVVTWVGAITASSPPASPSRRTTSSASSPTPPSRSSAT